MRLASLRLTKDVRIRVVVFLVVAVLAVTWGAVTYLKVPRLLGLGRYDLTVELPRAAGLYVNGVVTLRGVTVGQVDAVRLTPEGAAADIQILDGVQIPRDSAVEIRSTSAVGEQYVNFEPRSAAGPFLGDDETVAAGQVDIPVSTADLLEEVNALAASVPGEKLNTTVDELALAFAGTGQDLQRLIESTTLLTEEALANVEPTVRLIEGSETVLATQRDTAGDLRSYLGDLASFGDRLAASDGDLRGTLEVFPPALDEFARLVHDVGDPLPGLLANLTSVGEVTRVYIPHLAQTLTLAQPTFTRSIATLTASPVPGTIMINLQTQVNDPAPCTEGFIRERRPPTDVSPARPGVDVRCTDPNPDKAVRGGKNYLCPPGSPLPDGRSPDAAGCELRFQTPEEAAAAREAAIATQLEVAGRQSQDASQNPLRNPNLPGTGPNTNPEENYPYGDEFLAPRTSGDPDLLAGVFTAPGSSAPLVYGDRIPSQNEGWPAFLLDPLGVAGPEEE